jgi:ATP/maltotriose-dependent transcriptional regulator MalT/DNA-binding SARP family transcriptional activator
MEEGARVTSRGAAPAPPTVLKRPRLDDLLAEVQQRRLTFAVAGAGFGKTTLLASWAGAFNSAWYSVTPEDRFYSNFAQGLFDVLRLRVPGLPPEIRTTVEGVGGSDAEDPGGRAQAFAAALCQALFSSLTSDLILVLDDVHELGRDGGSVKLVEALCRGAPPMLHVVVSGRDDPPFPVERLRGQGQLIEIHGPELAFTVDESQELLRHSLGADSETLARDVHEVTGGWPAAVRLTLEALRNVGADDRAQRLDAVKAPGGSLFAYLAEEVFGAEPQDVKELLRSVASLERFTPSLCAFLGHSQARELLPTLARRGLFVEEAKGELGWFTLGALARQFILEYAAPPEADVVLIHTRAADWFEAHGYLEEALQSLMAIGDQDVLSEFLDRRGSSLLSRGKVDAVLTAVDTIDSKSRSSRVERLAGEALQIRGAWEAALSSLERAAGKGDLPPDIGWRIGLIYYLRGDLDGALSAFARVPDYDEKSVDGALLEAWTSTVYWARGEFENCRDHAERALEIASATKDDSALAATHTTLAMLAAVEGNRRANDEHYLRALEHAEKAGDALHIIRIRSNRSSHHMEEGYYEEALGELEMAISLADLTGFTAYRALCLTNRGETHLYLGRLEEAISDLEAARDLYQKIGSRNVAYPLGRLGDVYRVRGDFAMARACYFEALDQAEASQDMQGLVPATAGLARVEAYDDPDRARELAERAVSYGPGLSYVFALLSQGWVALSGGDSTTARRAASDAMTAARTRRDRAGIAESLEVEALATQDRDRALGHLEEAAALWQHIKNPINELRAKLGKARILGGSEGRSLAESVEDKARTLGARRIAAEAAELLEAIGSSAATGVRIETLGGFRVVREDGVVPAGAWQSKKARDLLKILVARRGHPIPKEELMEMLWPDDDASALRNRFSVAVTTVRSVLDPDRRWPQDQFVVSSIESIALRTEHLTVDVESFLNDAEAGLRKRRIGDVGSSRDDLLRAEASYRGDFLEEDAYEDWAVPVREQARATYLQVVRVLAGDAISAEDPPTAQRYLLRILERDAYDEGAHLSFVKALVAERRHGEARRAYRLYCARMEEIDVEAAPFPSDR